MRPRPFLTGLILVGLVAAAWAMVALPAQATYGARVTADEPQYLLSALSLGEDLDLDISDEIADRAYEPFHEITLDPQTEANGDGREFSPHDPLLPVILAVPMALGGWAAAKATLALFAGVLAALLVWVSVERFGVSRAPATVVVLAFALSAPLTSYGTQVYPELPAALAVTLAIAALTGPLQRRGQWALLAAVVALPWLSVKYAPVAVALVGVGAWTLWRRGDRQAVLRSAGVLAVAGIAYLVLHQLVYGGWTVYAAGDHFQETGQLGVTGESPHYLARSQRLVGLIVDRGFGLAAWAPVYLAAIPAFGALARRRPPFWPALALPLAAGWANATWIALTMHGWWWPGRQTVVVLPCVVLATAWWVGTLTHSSGFAALSNSGAADRGWRSALPPLTGRGRHPDRGGDRRTRRAGRRALGVAGRRGAAAAIAPHHRLRGDGQPALPGLATGPAGPASAGWVHAGAVGGVDGRAGGAGLVGLALGRVSRR